jgi:predicted GNAT family acetyltransferase
MSLVSSDRDWAPIGTGSVSILRTGQEDAVWRLVSQNPDRHCFAAARLSAGGLRSDRLGGQIWGYHPQGRVESAVLVGANMVPIQTSPEAIRAFADFAVIQGRRCSSIVGPAREVTALWQQLEPWWSPAREVRANQPFLSATRPAEVEPDNLVRPATQNELELLFPACVSMFTEEVGVSPLLAGGEPGYRRKIAELIAQRRAFVRMQGRTPIFKAELGAVSAQSCQVQGVWVHPDFRGQGLASSAMAKVVELARAHAPRVTLYVNAFNAPALAAYRRSGFVTTDTFATILF